MQTCVESRWIGSNEIILVSLLSWGRLMIGLESHRAVINQWNHDILCLKLVELYAGLIMEWKTDAVQVISRGGVYLQPWIMNQSLW